MNNRPKLMIVGAFPSKDKMVFGGIVTSCKALLGSSLPKRVELELIDSTQISNPPPVLFLRLLIAIRRVVEFLIRFEAFRPDAILVFTSTGASLIEKGAMARYARLRGVPALVFPRGGRLLDDFDRSCFSRWSARFSLSRATKILCQGEQWQEFVTTKLHRAIEDAPLVRNWTATNELLEIGQNRRTRDFNSPIRLLFVGWLDRKKGVMDLLEVMARFSNTRDLVLDCVGEGNVSQLARQRVGEYGLADRVRFRGWLQGEVLVKVFRDADIFVLPSWAEGLPNAMIEAMAARLAIVATAVGNIPSVIADGDNGLLVPPKDLEALERALDRMITDVAMRNVLADHAYNFAKDQFGVETAVGKIIGIVEDVTGISARPLAFDAEFLPDDGRAK